MASIDFNNFLKLQFLALSKTAVWTKTTIRSTLPFCSAPKPLQIFYVFYFLLQISHQFKKDTYQKLIFEAYKVDRLHNKNWETEAPLLTNKFFKLMHFGNAQEAKNEKMYKKHI